MNLRNAARKIAYRSGAMDMVHRMRHDQCLTVLMFHRVQPVEERKRSGADPRYTVTPGLLEAIVGFLRRNYSIVSARDVLLSLGQSKALPPRPALITFDDGWRDNLEWASPMLRGLPWILFVATDAVGEPDCWWQEVLLWALRSGRADYTDLWQCAAPNGVNSKVPDKQNVLLLLMRYGALNPEHRRRALQLHEEALRSSCKTRHMLTAAELQELVRNNVDVGSHGASHLPLSLLDDVVGDLSRSKKWLADLSSVPAMSIPHGRYGETTIRAARDLGYSAIFTSDAILNPCPNGWLLDDVIGRICLDPVAVSDRLGRLVPDRLAAHLYRRQIGNLRGELS
jgi:peptidoglycan/xylan/chitin deacetylase (PgdA/CDA1 family)